MPTDELEDTLPRGPHDLTREQVEASQRRRLLAAMTDVVGSQGYVKTSVADVIQRAGVSRATFYALFRDKEDCFCAAFESAAAEIGSAMILALSEQEERNQLQARAEPEAATTESFNYEDAVVRLHDPPPVAAQSTIVERIDSLLSVYLHVLSNYSTLARTFLVEVYAAGPRAIQQRRDSMERLIDIITFAVYDGDNATEEQRFGVRVVVNAVSAMVTMSVGTNSESELPLLREPIVRLAKMILAQQGHASWSD